MGMDPDPNARAWIEQWRAAADALPRRRARELAALSEADALAAASDLLSLATPPAERGSGLVEQQRIFASAPRP